MHPLPANRGEEVSAFVFESERSLVWRQAANRLSAHVAAIVHATGASGVPAHRYRATASDRG